MIKISKPFATGLGGQTIIGTAWVKEREQNQRKNCKMKNRREPKGGKTGRTFLSLSLLFEIFIACKVSLVPACQEIKKFGNTENRWQMQSPHFQWIQQSGVIRADEWMAGSRAHTCHSVVRSRRVNLRDSAWNLHTKTETIHEIVNNKSAIQALRRP